LLLLRITTLGLLSSRQSEAGAHSETSTTQRKSRVERLSGNSDAARKDPHAVTEVMETELPEGKTNDGNMLYGRAARHKDVRLCAVNGFAF
jgi:hypothetical protein